VTTARSITRCRPDACGKPRFIPSAWDEAPAARGLSKEAPDAKRHADNFEPVEAVKSVSLDPSNDARKKV
jgi:hypothetical protein